MKVNSVEIHPASSSDICVLSFRDPKRSNPFNVKGITGLDADEIVPRYYGVSDNSNSKFYNLSLERREIVVLVEMNPDFAENQTYSDLRARLYRLIASSRTGVVQLQFKRDGIVVAAISGFVTKFEASHFSKTPEVQITIRCDDPMLRDLTAYSMIVDDLDPALTNIQDALSTAPHGVTFAMNFLADLSSFVIRGAGADDWSFTVTPAGGFLEDDILHCSSEYNNKQLYVSRGVSIIHLADVVAPGSAWPVIFPGDNLFVCEDSESLAWNSISYYSTYWGV